jgi:hypothetical protein
MRDASPGKIKLTRKKHRKDSQIHMDEQRSFWQRLLGRTGTSSLSQRQEKVLHYIIGRIDKDVPVQQILQEDYVRRNCSQQEIEQIISHPEFVQAARERLGESFRSEEFRL